MIVAAIFRHWELTEFVSTTNFATLTTFEVQAKLLIRLDKVLFVEFGMALALLRAFERATEFSGNTGPGHPVQRQVLGGGYKP